MTSCRATAKETAIFAKIWYPRYHALSRKKSKFPRYVLHEMQRKTSCYSKYFAQYFVIPATFRVMSRKSVQCTVQYHSQLTEAIGENLWLFHFPCAKSAFIFFNCQHGYWLVFDSVQLLWARSRLRVLKIPEPEPTEHCLAQCTHTC